MITNNYVTLHYIYYTNDYIIVDYTNDIITADCINNYITVNIDNSELFILF